MSRRSISLLSSLLFVLLLFSPTILADNEQQFQDLLRDVPEDRLHAALHDYGGSKFKHGVFPGDRPALDVIHRERAADATRLVKLAKRQSNTTTTSRDTATTPRTTPTTAVTTPPSSASPTTRGPTTTNSNSDSNPASAAARRTTSLTSKLTRTVTGPDGVSTITDTAVVVATSSDESVVTPEATPAITTSGGGLQNVGLRVSGGDSVIVAVIAALGFFML
ncbi:unnamed protein product [Tuber aestivum]|uniref:Uncharacterized protein n=1 Tax=Tuber aestivum TaxID=59557 RepID=A0A292Q5Z7_9PEZI|nr:unnamed protein product [Tuber aestivum]